MNRALAPFLFAVLAACGGLDSADQVLSTAQVAGTLANARPGAYVYVFGSPQHRAAVHGDGSFQLDRVPLGTGAAQLVLYDGGALGEGKADLVDVALRPASRAQVDHDAALMPLAGSIVAAVRCTGGQRADAATYTVEGSEFEGKGGSDGVTLYPLPPKHTYTLKSSLPGFKDSSQEVAVPEGSSAPLTLDMDADESSGKRGCVSTGCADGRACAGDDGRCYECTSDSDCKDSSAPRCESHACTPSGGERSACLPCAADADCAGGAAGATALCIPSSDGSGRVCSHGCSANADCPSGMSCTTTQQGAACVASPSCAGMLQAFGQQCTDDAACSSALSDPICFGLVRQKGTVLQAGYCSSRCEANTDCPTSLGFSCNAGSCTR